MQLTSSQRWAIGAVALAVLLACSPRTPDEPVRPPPQAPKVSAITSGQAAPESAQPAAFAGDWAFAESDCSEAARTFKLSADKIVMSPGERSCAVTSISEEHPTGRSMIYHVAADCVAEGEATKDRFTLNFGASDTVMQMQLNNREPVRLVRCP
jgi:hypothetical protein